MTDIKDAENAREDAENAREHAAQATSSARQAFDCARQKAEGARTEFIGWQNIGVNDITLATAHKGWCDAVSLLAGATGALERAMVAEMNAMDDLQIAMRLVLKTTGDRLGAPA